MAHNPNQRRMTARGKHTEMLFFFTKGPKYHFSREHLNGEEDIWKISKRPKHARGVHSAAFPDELVQKCLDVGCRAPAKSLTLSREAGRFFVLRLRAGGLRLELT